MKKLIISILLMTFSSFTIADGDHPISSITGENIELSLVDHAIAGRIGENLILGNVSTGDGHQQSTLVLKNHDGMSTTVFGNNNGQWGGTLGQRQIELVKVVREIPAYIIAVNGVEYTVRVESDDYQNNHFIRPTYILELDGKEIAAKMHEGQACWKFSLHLIFMIFGTYLI